MVYIGGGPASLRCPGPFGRHEDGHDHYVAHPAATYWSGEEIPPASLLCPVCTAQLRALAADDPDDYGPLFREMRRVARELRKGVELDGTHRDPNEFSLLTTPMIGLQLRQDEVTQVLKERAMLARRNAKAARADA